MGRHQGAMSLKPTRIRGHDPSPQLESPDLPRRHRLALFLIPPLAALGPWASFTPGAELSPYFFRILLALSIVPALGNLSAHLRYAPPAVRRAITATAALIGWGLIGLLWTPEIWVGFRDIVGVLLGLLTVLVSLGLARGRTEGVASIRWGFLAALIATGAIALWEVRTGLHLRQFSHGSYGFAATAASSTFINPNNFGSFILGVLGPCIVLVARRRTLIRQLILALGPITAGYLAVQSESRGAVFGTLIIIAVALLALAAVNIGYFLMASLIASPVALAAFFYFNTYLQDILRTITTDADQASDAVRVQLLRQALRYFWESFGIGTGPGSYLATVASDPDRLTPVTPAHNTLAQVAAEYGIVGLVALLTVMIACCSPLFSPAHAPIQRHIKFEVVLTLTALVGASVIASSVLGDPSWWVLVAYMLCLASQFRASTVDTPNTSTSTGSWQQPS